MNPDFDQRKYLDTLDLPKGDWREEWIDTRTGAVAQRGAFLHEGGARDVTGPPTRSTWPFGWSGETAIADPRRVVIQ